jgi:glycosyltransferase involved in cell wall biosynthesis
MRALRIYHSGVVSSWRQRDRNLRANGIDVTLVSPVEWNEGGAPVRLDVGGDDFVVPARTVGRHPYAFVYDPRPIWRALRAAPVDVLDVHEEPASLAAAEVLLLRWASGRRPPVLFYGAQNLEKRFPPPFRWIEAVALRVAAATFVCNDDAGRIYRRKGFRGLVRTIGLGIDVERFAPAATPLPPRPFRLGYVGRLEWRKGVHVLLEAMQWVPDGVELHVHGTGPDEDALRTLAEFLGVADRVRFHGFTPHGELPEVYRSFHALAVPSQTTPSWVEQFGRVVVEAMASGVPVIGSDSGSIPEVVGDAGIVVPEADARAWATAIGALADDPERAAALKAAGLRHVRRYTWSAVAAQHEALWREVAS